MGCFSCKYVQYTLIIQSIYARNQLVVVKFGCKHNSVRFMFLLDTKRGLCKIKFKQSACFRLHHYFILITSNSKLRENIFTVARNIIMNLHLNTNISFQ